MTRVRGLILTVALLSCCVSAAWAGAPPGDGGAVAPATPADSLRLAISDLMQTFGDKYPRGQEFLDRLAALNAAGKDGGEDLQKLRQEVLLANPLLDFDRLLVVRRAGHMGLPQNWQDDTSIPAKGYDNEIATLSPVAPGGQLKTLYRPADGRFVGDLDLHFDGSRLLFSMPSDAGRWQVFEIRADGTGLRQVTPGGPKDVDNFNGCYLPDGRIVFCSTACQQGIPCVTGSDKVSLLYLLSADGNTVRQLTFDQDHSWGPSIANDGRVMYSRWEYSDLPHYFSRLVFHMYPDGTGQTAMYGSNSYWPNSTFYARAIPGSPTKVVAIISGHHGVPRMGEMMIFDTARGQHEADGVVQRIPGAGRTVPATIADTLVDGSWPRFLHPRPLSEKYFLVSCQPDSRSPWGIYLVDVFDNMLKLAEAPGSALLEPVPLRKRPAPPTIPDRADPDRKDAEVYLTDVYAGPGLGGMPRGAVKRLRLYSLHYCYWKMGGHDFIGIDGPWDVKRILGTVPVQEDGSAAFRVPANTPIALQPLDEQGQALAIMRSWFTAMPGEKVSCVGCHERTSQAGLNRPSLALKAGPVPIEPWHGPARGFSFPREVQPVLDKYCVGCHAGQPRDGKTIPDLRLNPNGRGRFDSSYAALHPFVRRPGPESDCHLMPPAEYHANTSELVQMLRKDHHGVHLDAEAWDRLVTWIDLNVPDHGTWHEAIGRPDAKGFADRRRELSKLYAGIDEDFEAVGAAANLGPQVAPAPKPRVQAEPVTCPGWPLDAAQAARLQQAAAPGGKIQREIVLGEGMKFTLMLVPAGEFVMGDPAGAADEQPRRVRVQKPFWIGKFEVTNRQFAVFDAAHDSGYASVFGKDHSDRGIPLNGPDQPVVRVSWMRAMAFCRWLSEKTGETFTLPSEEQWEYACRAGTATPFFFGDLGADFSKFANVADAALNLRADWTPRDGRFNDGSSVTAPVGRYQPNAWNLHDMHGNAAEWTASPYDPYASVHGAAAAMVVRGGSWYDRPNRCRSSFRLAYPQWQRVYNVGFRVICPAGPVEAVAAKAPAGQAP